MLCMDDTLHEKDVLMNFANLALVKTTFPQNFVVDERPTKSFPPELHVTDNHACGLRQSSYSPPFSDLTLPITSGTKTYVEMALDKKAKRRT